MARTPKKETNVGTIADDVNKLYPAKSGKPIDGNPVTKESKMLINIPKDLGRPEPVMAGIYKVAVTGYKVDKSKSSENMLIKPEYTIQSQSDAEGKKVMGRKLFDNWTVAEQSIGIWAQAFKALTGNDLPSGQFELDEFINLVTSQISGKEALAQVEVEVDKTNPDVVRNRIKRLSPLMA